ncbi:MAG: tRNA uridine-5-carboxymethylaminomethyl(34) synthesis GTPase MnmE [Candidatus Omnitrophica bacterium]|nr:tRNA uridine-5-carboxymethylaminomethyl(34) synthesis GTPase MnmE [Candidatus Omnitrophota bacterium]MCF7891638.1 tRNA uridine-5-carboxymethylaminomethyl(34) synthesis GTPase MnmE [Candidatus Omnitrophota bacterium]MCF7895910.1 tRNA uridine-5-carboxymethylaminomethyl(34) synthesis GTPase MnmE [Candidatus Omnitrophota bacterium]MCF7897259.1 tRNA uridine-5-carboxymethylaminomethyl(34) synthesis GTPase MnmE [Candidatus Omnitrophota bacterium]MCF7909294.1 tRNA uridine-5-carboxymethylaminomethyl(
MSEFNLKDYKISDTITAIATAPSKAALGVVKISGKKSLSILDKIFVPKNKKDIKKVKNFTLHYGWIINSPKSKVQSLKSERIVDEVLVSIMKAPHSYTTEDVVEVSSHGGVLVLNQIVELILKKGARLAKPGEFSYRALINGRIDLLQAEAILKLVEAKTPKAVLLSSRQLKGENSKKLKDLKKDLKNIFIQTEAAINFPEEDISFDKTNLRKSLEKALKKVKRLQKSQGPADVLTQGLRCVICGRSNAGKSTLFNRLLRQERVIVSKVPGTTRDVIEESINIKGIPVKIYDTAGILEPEDFITRKALQKTNQVFNQADLVILLFDGSKKLSKDDKFLLDKTKDKNTILVINKTDLPEKIKFGQKDIDQHKFIRMSALKDNDLKRFEKMVYKAVYRKGIDKKDLIFLNQYQKKELDNLAESLSNTKEYLKKDYTLDFVNFSLKDSLESIGKITGEIIGEEILENIFSNFCIGK